MDARKAMITDIFNNSTLIEVPFFQRTYVWKEDLWARFLNDMEYVTKTNHLHFFGSIILKEQCIPASEENVADCRTIVDGQQRLTTFLIFMKVLCLKFGQLTSFDLQFRIMGEKIALRHGRNDIEAFEKIMAVTSLDIMDNTNPKSRVIDAYNYFVTHIDESKLNIMAIRRNIQFVRIDLDADEDEQQIFDTINSLGVNLTTSELLKNYFFNSDTVREYEEKWESVFDKDDDSKAYWDMEFEIGRSKRAMIDIFFDAYFQLFIQNRAYNISTEDKTMYNRIDNLAQSYQHFIENYCDGEKNVVLNQLKEYANCFRDIFTPDYCESNIPSTYGIERLNIIIFGLKVSTLIPYILYVAKNVHDVEEKNRIYGILESYIMRRMIVRANTKNYNNLFPSLILNSVLNSEILLNRLKSSNDSTMYIPNNEELLTGFYHSKLVNLQTKGILYLIESKIRLANNATLLYGFNHYSLEHLMPKKWRNHWEACESEELAKNRDEILLTLGNLAIIPQPLNASIRDANWQIKKEGNGDKKPGLSKCAAGLDTLHDTLKKSQWNESEIESRARWLWKKAIEIWNMGVDDFIPSDVVIHRNQHEYDDNNLEIQPNAERIVFYYKSGSEVGRIINASCIMKDSEFVVQTGSQMATIPTPSCNRWIKGKRREFSSLIDENGILHGDVSFPTPSGAAEFVAFACSNGKVLWKDENGIPLKEYLR